MTSEIHARTTPATRIGEGKEMHEYGVGGKSGEEALQGIKRTAEKVTHDICDACHNIKHYPKLLTVLLLSCAFLMGAVSNGLWWRASGAYQPSHHTREAVDAHRSLDILLEHAHAPQRYHPGMISRARNTLMDFVGSVTGGRWGGGYGRGESWTDTAGHEGGRLYEKAKGLKDDAVYGGERMYEKAKEAGYEAKEKAGGLFQGVKESLMGKGREYAEEYGGKGRGRGWMGGSTSGYDAEKERLEEADRHLRHVMRQAEKEM